MNAKSEGTIQFINVDPEKHLLDIASKVQGIMIETCRKVLREEKREEKREEFLKVKEVAGLLKIDKSTVYRWSSGENRTLNPITIRNITRFKKSEVEDMLNRKPTLSKKTKGK